MMAGRIILFVKLNKATQELCWRPSANLLRLKKALTYDMKLECRQIGAGMLAQGITRNFKIGKYRLHGRPEPRAVIHFP